MALLPMGTEIEQAELIDLADQADQADHLDAQESMFDHQTHFPDAYLDEPAVEEPPVEELELGVEEAIHSAAPVSISSEPHLFTSPSQPAASAEPTLQAWQPSPAPVAEPEPASLQPEASSQVLPESAQTEAAEPVAVVPETPAAPLQATAEQIAESAALSSEPLTVDDFAALEDRVIRAVSLVRRERQARLAAEEQVAALHVTIAALDAQAQEQSPLVNQLQQEVDSLRAEREQVRLRVERLLSQLDSLEL